MPKTNQNNNQVIDISNPIQNEDITETNSTHEDLSSDQDAGQADKKTKSPAKSSSLAKKKIDTSKKAEEKKAAEAKRKAEASKKAEEKKEAEAKRKAEASKKAEEKKEAEAKRKAETSKKNEERKEAEAKKKAEASKKAEEKKAAEAKRKAEANKKAETVKKSKTDTKTAKKAQDEKKEPDENEEPTEAKIEKEKEQKSDTKKKSGKSTKKSTEKKAPTEKKPSEKWSIKKLGGALFAKMLRGGASELNSKAEEVNKLNVFPVPDGDTGDNMSMTIKSGVSSLENIDTDDLAEVLRVASRGMLLGARGNSGVILSQFFAGMAKGLENIETADAKELGKALEMGVQQAYTSVMTPTEGTILTVAREAVEYAVSRVTAKSTVQSLFSDLVNEMNVSLQRTPDILPALGEAGVVDSGGAGLLYIIDGLNRVLNGEDVDDSEMEFEKPKSISVDEGNFGPDTEMKYGYCTELLVQLMNKKLAERPFDLETLRLHLSTLGDSIVVFQTEMIVKIHIHTLRPDKVLRYMLKFGDFISVKIENMSLQHTELENNRVNVDSAESAPKKKFGIVAVSNGDGISNLFRELGTDEVVEGGQTNNPSTNDFIDAFDKINAENIFVFPNNGNIIMAAGQAAEIYEKAKVYVVPTKSIGAGYVAMSTMSFDLGEPDDLMAEAADAISRITSAYVSPAVRDADMNGVHVTDGDTIGIINKEIVISGPDKMVSTYGLIDIMLADEAKFMITVFHGKDASIEERDRLAEYMLQTYPMVEAYYVDGGQDIYPFMFVAE